MLDCGIERCFRSYLVPQAEIQLFAPLKIKTAKFLIFHLFSPFWLCTGQLSELQKNTHFRRFTRPFLLVFDRIILTYGGRWDCTPSIWQFFRIYWPFLYFWQKFPNFTTMWRSYVIAWFNLDDKRFYEKSSLLSTLRGNCRVAFTIFILKSAPKLRRQQVARWCATLKKNSISAIYTKYLGHAFNAE